MERGGEDWVSLSPRQVQFCAGTGLPQFVNANVCVNAVALTRALALSLALVVCVFCFGHTHTHKQRVTLSEKAKILLILLRFLIKEEF